MSQTFLFVLIFCYIFVYMGSFNKNKNKNKNNSKELTRDILSNFDNFNVLCSLSVIIEHFYISDPIWFLLLYPITFTFIACSLTTVQLRFCIDFWIIPYYN